MFSSPVTLSMVDHRTFDKENTQMSSRLLHSQWAGDVVSFWFEELSPKDWFVKKRRRIGQSPIGLRICLNI